MHICLVAGLLTMATLAVMRVERSTENFKVNGRLDVGTGSGGDHEIRIYKADNNVSDHIQFYNGTTRIGEIGCEDTTWLRINQETNKNIYTPRYIRADNGFFIDGTSYGIAGDAEFRAKHGSASDPGITFGGDTDTGIYRNGSNKISFCSNGVRRCDMSSGNFTFPGIWNNTTSSGSAVRVTNGGRLRRQGSSRKYKTNIEPMDYAYCDNVLDNAEPIFGIALVFLTLSFLKNILIGSLKSSRRTTGDRKLRRLL